MKRYGATLTRWSPLSTTKKDANTSSGSSSTDNRTECQREEENRAFLNYFNQEEQVQERATEGKLVQILEEGEEEEGRNGASATIAVASVQNTRFRQPRDLRRDNFSPIKISSVHDRLPFIVQRMSSGRRLVDGLTNEIDHTKDKDNHLEEGKESNEVVPPPTKESKEVPSLKQPKRFVGKGLRSRRNVHSSGGHRRNLSSTDRFYEYTDKLVTAEKEGRHKRSLSLNIPEGDDEKEEDSVSTASLDEEDQDTIGTADVETPIIGGGSKIIRKRSRFARNLEILISVIGIDDILNHIKVFLSCTFMLAILPLLLSSAVIFYYFGNPVIDVLHSKATLSWWLLFIARQLITWHLAKSTEYLFFVIINGTTLITNIFGPFIALFIMQATGWPLVVTSWGVWDWILVQGTHPFCQNWFHVLNIRLFSIDYNTDGGILNSDMYERILIAMIMTGVAATVKRTSVALYLGRRMLQHYKPQLVEILHDMDFVAEIAELAIETEREGFDSLLSVQFPSFKKMEVVERVPRFSSGMNVGEIDIDDSMDDSDGHYGKIGVDFNHDDNAKGNAKTPNTTDDTWDEDHHKALWEQLKSTAEQQKSLDDWNDVDFAIEKNTTPDLNSRLKQVREGRQRQNTTANGSGADKKMTLLEPWQEPEERASKKEMTSILDILQFRKAMAFMQKKYPFSTAFGLANTRKACVKSSIRVYRQLLKYAPPPNNEMSKIKSPKPLSRPGSGSGSGSSASLGSISEVLPFDVIGALAYDEKGDLIEDRARALLRLFLPDKDNNLPEIAFLQSIDSLYKKLRFLRASLLNSSKIDSVLEDMFNVIYWMVMIIVIIFLLGWNPWPLLVSFSTLTVSFAFAFGPSAAKYIEGILLIAIRRPFDIGDRITISAPESIHQVQPQDGETWFVQDITLTTTTLRYATTNEVSTINNFAIANSRIMNCTRSEKPIITIRVKFKLEKVIEENSKIDLFRSRIDVYLKDRPRTWGSNGLLHFRTNKIDTDNCYVEYLLRAQYVKSWQDLGHVLVQQGELDRYCVHTAMKLGILFEVQRTGLDVLMRDAVVESDKKESSTQS